MLLIRFLLACLCSMAVPAGAITGDGAGPPAAERSSNDGVGYQTVVVKGSYRNFAPIHEAAKRGDVAAIREELRRGVPVDLRVANSGGNGWWRDTTPLMWAAM